MLMAAEQVRWIPISAIHGWRESKEAAEERDLDGATVLLAETEVGSYTLLAGKARLEELCRLGQTCVDAVVQGGLDARVSRLLTRLADGSLHYLEEAACCRELIESGMTRQELGQRLGRSQESLRKRMRLLELDEETRARLVSLSLAEGYAHALLRLPSARGRLRLLRQIEEQQLRVRDVEAIVEESLTRLPIPVPKERRLLPAMRDHRLYVNAIRGIVEQMRESGVGAEMQLTTGALLVEIRITVPRFGAKAARCP